jgi:CRISPR-associated protein Cmr4
MNNTALLGLLAETSIHAGAGQMAGVIDLPIQREAHTDWPVVYGSAVKGALRTLAEEQKEQTAPWLTAVFGPETGNASEHAGALLVGDARLLLLPVRSLTSHFKWVTCPALLGRLRADLERLGLPAFAADVIPKVEEANTARVPEGAENALFLEEFRFETRVADLSAVIPTLAGLMSREDAAAALQKQLVVVGDDRFSHLARYATPVNPHVCLDDATKTVRPGALWYEESLPSDTVLYVGLHAQAARMKGETLTAAEVLDRFLTLFARPYLQPRPYLQLGGNETVGMGWCKVTIRRGEG